MLLTNHVLTGALLGLSIDNPVLLAPTAVASHLALDAVPHFGTDSLRKSFPNGRFFIIVGAADFTMSVAATTVICLMWPERIVNILIGVFGACLPDLTYIPLVVFGRARIERWLPFYKPMLQFLGWIQWYERPPGAVTEVLWAILMLYLLHAHITVPA
ncbi:MAG TPA: hypothetical protein VHQ86_01940 [Candidatus Saccharimonadia bacterium]|jgi:hypothetical protein|nr:hypothetical protein [Candidatus Saccharimonadia bacterium]